MIYPVAQALYYSFFDWSGMSQNKTFIGLDNFKEMFQDPIMWRSIGNDYFLVVGKIDRHHAYRYLLRGCANTI